MAEVVALRTANAKTFTTATPGRYVSRIYAAPIHFRDAAGAWRNIDTTLVPSGDGRLRTRANSVPVDLAAVAGDPQLARVDFGGGRSVAYRLHGAAPVPVTTSGSVANYAAVLPDVAVELTAFWGGLKEELVLTSLSAPDTYVFPLTLQGLTAVLDEPTGAVHYEDDDGETVAVTPPGSMHDSTPPRPDGGEANPPPGVRPYSDAVSYELVAHEGGTALKVTLDRAWLDDPARTYPVRVDPTTTFYANTDDTYVATNDTTRNDTLGDLNSGTDNCCSASTIRFRSFIHFDTGWLRGRAKGISTARIATYLFGGWSCAARPTSLYRVTQGWWGGSMMAYPGASVGEEIHRMDINPCPNTWIQWTGLQGVVHNWAVAQTWEDNGVMIRAYDENDNSIWRRFYSANQPGHSPHLVVDWWGMPNTPDNLSPADATYTSPPTLSARYTHSDEQTGGTIYFDLYSSGGTRLYQSTGQSVCHGCTRSHVPSSLADGRYQWDVIASDTAGRSSPRTARRWFTLDRKPNVPDQLSPATGTAGQAPPTLSARYNHTDPGNSSGQVLFKLYDGAGTFLSQTYSATVCKGCTATHTPTGLADGLYQWEAVAYDGGGTSNANAFSAASSRRTFRVDTTAPGEPASLSSSSHPDPAAWYATRAFAASWTAPTDPTGIAGYAVVLDQEPSTVPAPTVTDTTTSHSSTVASDGQWYLHVRAVDDVGNWGPTAHLGFKADATTPGTPTVTSDAHTDESAWYADADPVFRWSGGDTASGLAGWSFLLDQASTTEPDTTSEGTTALRSYTDLADGSHWFHVRRKNNAGTWGPPTHRRVQVDSTAPVVASVSSSTHPVESTWYANANPTVSWSATDTAPVDGYSWLLDQVATTTPDTSSEGSATTASWTGRADGLWWFHVRARNATGTWGPAVHRAVRIDAVVNPPTVTSSSHPVQTTWYAVDDVVLSWATSEESGVAGYSYTFDGTEPDTVSEGTASTRTYADMPDGTYTFKVRVVNGLGQWSGTSVFTARVDTTAPIVSSTSSSTHPDESTWYANANPTVVWTASDTSGVTGYSWILDQIAATTPDTTSEGTATSQSWTGKADGLWWFHLRAKNGAGTWGPTLHRAVRVDTTAPAAPPVASATHPDPDEWYSNDAPSFGFATADDAPVDGYSYVLDQVATTTPDTTSEGTAATRAYSGIANGEHWFHVRARNTTSGWGATAHFRVRVDTTSGSPTVTSSTHLSQTAWYSSTAPTLSWTASYPSGVEGWSYVRDTSSSTTPDTTSEGTGTSTGYTGLADGTHWFHLRARTGAGTWTGTTHFKLQIDSTSPAAPIVSSTTHPSQTAWYANSNPEVSWSGTDTAPVDGWSWVRDQSATTTPDTTSEGTASSVSFTGLADGTHWLHVRARNSAGLWGATAHFKLQIDTSGPLAPTVNSTTHPSQTLWYSSNAPTVAWSGTDTAPVDGWSWVRDQSATTTPDAISEGTATSANLTGLADGVHWLHVRARNSAGLWGATTHFKLQVDSTAPAVPTVSSSTHPSQTAWSSSANASMSFTATDTAPVTDYSWSLDQMATTTPDTTTDGSVTSTTVTPGEGDYWFHVRARNSSGLWGAAAHYKLRTDAVVGTATISSSSHPDQSTWYPALDAALSWTASEESGIAGYATSITPDVAGNPGTTVNRTTAAASATLAEDRVWFFNVRVKSNSGVWGPAASYRLRADASGPAKPVAAAPGFASDEQWYRNDDPSFTVTASDVSGITGYSYALDRSPESVPDSSVDATTEPIDFADVADGEWWFHVRAVNGSSLASPTTRVRVRIDTTAPMSQWVEDMPSTVPPGGTVTFRIGWDTAAAPASRVRAVVCKGVVPEASGACAVTWALGSPGSASPAEAKYVVSAEDVGQQHYTAFACDEVDLCSAAHVGYFHVSGPATGSSESGSSFSAAQASPRDESGHYPQKWQVDPQQRWWFGSDFPTADSRWTRRVREAAAEWDTLPGLRRFVFDRAMHSALDWAEWCARIEGEVDPSPRIVITTRLPNGMPHPGSGTPAAMVPCISTWGEERLLGALLWINPSVNWHLSQEGPIASNALDLESVATHEFGHVTGWGARHLSGSPCTFNSSYNTMCPAVWRGTAYLRSLEDRDRHYHYRAYTRGYWVAASDGGVFSFGGARFYGSLGGIRLNQPVVGIAARPQGDGYWMVAGDGGIFAFNAADYYGSLPGDRIRVGNIIGMAATPSGKGYWIAGSDGGVFAYGDAPFHGSLGDIYLPHPVVAIEATPTGNGYWLLGQDGSVFAFGDAPYRGSRWGTTGETFVGIDAVWSRVDGKAVTLGYTIVTTAGTAYDFSSSSGNVVRIDLPGMNPHVTRLVGVDGTWPVTDSTAKRGYNFIGFEDWGGQAYARVRRWGDAGYWGQPVRQLAGRPVGIALKETGG